MNAAGYTLGLLWRKLNLQQILSVELLTTLNEKKLKCPQQIPGTSRYVLDSTYYVTAWTL
ncbi:hypothetical protein CCP3SC1_40047 [Gammaproteobacteria bacterium]